MQSRHSRRSRRVLEPCRGNERRQVPAEYVARPPRRQCAQQRYTEDNMIPRRQVTARVAPRRRYAAQHTPVRYRPDAASRWRYGEMPPPPTRERLRFGNAILNRYGVCSSLEHISSRARSVYGVATQAERRVAARYRPASRVPGTACRLPQWQPLLPAVRSSHSTHCGSCEAWRAERSAPQRAAKRAARRESRGTGAYGKQKRAAQAPRGSGAAVCGR